MTLADLLRETLEVDCDEVWANERTPTPVRVFGVRLHSMGLSLREIVAVFRWLGVDRSHGAVWNWTHTLSEAQADPATAPPSRVTVDEKRIEVALLKPPSSGDSVLKYHRSRFQLPTFSDGKSKTM